MDTQKFVTLGFGVLFIAGLVFITYLNPYPTDRQWFLYCAVLGLGGGGFAASLPGAIEWQVSAKLKATGALAVLLLLLILGTRVTSSETAVKSWSLTSPAKGIAPNPNSATVYVALDEKIIKHFGRHPTLKTDNPETGQDMSIDRGPLGLVIDIERLRPGQLLYFIVEDESHWWVSQSIRVPPHYPLSLTEATDEEIKKRTQ